jgi:hypothetical protein
MKMKMKTKKKENASSREDYDDNATRLPETRPREQQQQQQQQRRDAKRLRSTDGYFGNRLFQLRRGHQRSVSSRSAHAHRESREGRTRRVHALGHNHLTPYDAARDDDDIRTFHFYEHAAFDGESWVSFIVDFSSSLGF